MTRGYADIVVIFKTLVVGTVSILSYLYQPFISPSQQVRPSLPATPTEIPVLGVMTTSVPEFTTMNDSVATEATLSEASTIELPFPTPFQTISTISTPTPTRRPTATPRPTLTATIKPSPNPSPTQPPKPTTSPTPTPRTSNVPSLPAYTPVPTITKSLSAEYLFQLINSHRESRQLPPFQKNDYLCKLAEDRIPELAQEISGKKYIHQGLYDRNLPYWITENMAYYSSEKENLQWWLNSSLHRKPIEGNYTYSCGACSGNSCIQLFTNFVER